MLAIFTMVVYLGDIIHPNSISYIATTLIYNNTESDEIVTRIGSKSHTISMKNISQPTHNNPNPDKGNMKSGIFANHNGPCDYLNVKGIEKSGTTWLEKGVLPAILDRACNITNNTLFLCPSNHSINHLQKHAMSLPQITMNDPWYSANSTDILIIEHQIDGITM